MAQINEGTSGHIKRIVPTIFILVLPSVLNPFEDFAEGVKLDLSVCQITGFKAALVSLFSTLLYAK